MKNFMITVELLVSNNMMKMQWLTETESARRHKRDPLWHSCNWLVSTLSLRVLYVHDHLCHEYPQHKLLVSNPCQWSFNLNYVGLRILVRGGYCSMIIFPTWSWLCHRYPYTIGITVTPLNLKTYPILIKKYGIECTRMSGRHASLSRMPLKVCSIQSK